MIAVVIILGAVYTLQKVQKGAPGSLRIGVIYSRSPGFQNTYALSHKRGIEAMQKKLGIKDSQIIQREDVWTDDEKTIAIAMEELLNEIPSLLFLWGQRQTEKISFPATSGLMKQATFRVWSPEKILLQVISAMSHAMEMRILFPQPSSRPLPWELPLLIRIPP